MGDGDVRQRNETSGSATGVGFFFFFCSWFSRHGKSPKALGGLVRVFGGKKKKACGPFACGFWAGSFGHVLCAVRGSTNETSSGPKIFERDAELRNASPFAKAKPTHNSSNH